MIEPEHAERLGFSVELKTGDRAHAERAARRLQSLGVRHVRLQLSAADHADGGWLAWALDRLARDFELLPSVASGAGNVAPDGALSRVLHHAATFKFVELRDTCDTADVEPCVLRAGAAMANAAGCGMVIALDGDDIATRMTAYGQAGLLTLVSAVGLRRLGAAGRLASDHALALAQPVVDRYNPALPLWLSAVGRSTWRHEIAEQIEVFRDALSSRAERVYWHTLTDDTARDSRDCEAHFGVDDAHGPKLLGRLLDGGTRGIEPLLSLTRGAKSPAVIGIKPVLVTGGAGFIGANLADRLAADGEHVEIFDALARPGVERNLRWLARRHPSKISFVLGDLRDEAATRQAARSAGVVFHLAGQVAVTTSMVHPTADFEVNARGTVAILETLRQHNPTAPLIFASTNKVYGDLADIELARQGDCYLPKRADYRARGVSETRPLCFHTPYGCSKGTADQYVLDYAHSFGLRTAVLRMSCIYGERQLGTEDQGWVAHFLLRAIAGERVTIYGDGRQVRDILHVGDAVAAYRAAWQGIDRIAGRAYNLGGGPANAVSLLQLIEHIETILGRRVAVEFSAWRPGDQRYFVADTTAARRDLHLPAALGWHAGLQRLAAHFGVSVAEQAQVEAAL